MSNYIYPKYIRFVDALPVTPTFKVEKHKLKDMLMEELGLYSSTKRVPMSSIKPCSIVISGAGLYTPEHDITNEELVTSCNCWASQYNAELSVKIEKDDLEAKLLSSY